MPFDIDLNQLNFLELLEKLIGETKWLQNRPPELIPEEDRAGGHIIAALTPYTVENGGTLILRRIGFTTGRGNIIVEYPALESGR